MLVINKITKTSYIILNKNKNNDRIDINKYIYPKIYKANKKISNEENIVNDFLIELEYLEFNVETYTPYINYKNIANDFKKLIYNKLN